MLPFPHPKSILIMDNCSIHHIEHVTTLIEEAGILLLFLPPYSPDLNPIECVFGFVKGYLKEYEHISCAFPDSRVLLKSAFEHDMCILFVPENRLYHVQPSVSLRLFQPPSSSLCDYYTWTAYFQAKASETFSCSRWRLL